MPQNRYVRIISKDLLLESFYTGINNFLSLYSLQSNKNYISSNAGNFFLMGQNVHTNNIRSSEVKKVNDLKAILNRLEHNENREEKEKEFLLKFGAKLSELSSKSYDDSRDRFITSHYSFISLSILHNACIQNLPYSTYISMKDLFIHYLSPNGRAPEMTSYLFRFIGKSLEDIGKNDSIFLESSRSFDISLVENTNSTDKLWALLCGENSHNLPLKYYLTDDEIKKYKQLSIKIKKYHNHKEELSNQTDISLEPEIYNRILTTYNKIISALERIKWISAGIIAYQIDFDIHTDGLTMKNSTPPEFLFDPGYSFISSNYKRITTDYLEKEMGGKNPVGSLKKLQTILPPSLIVSIAKDLISDIISYVSESKSYGILKRHGITGQTRALLLKTYIEQVVNLLKNNYYYIFSSSCQNSIVSQCNLIDKVINDFFVNYKNATKKLPNHDRKRSLFYYLSMYCDPQSDIDNFKPNQKFIDIWNKSKAKHLYK